MPLAASAIWPFREEDRRRHRSDLIELYQRAVNGEGGRIPDAEIGKEPTRIIVTPQTDVRSEIDSNQHEAVVHLIKDSLKTWHLSAAWRAQTSPEVQYDWFAILENL